MWRRPLLLSIFLLLVAECCWSLQLLVAAAADTPEPVSAAPAYPSPPSYLELSDTEWRGSINTNMYLQRCVSKQLRARFYARAVDELKPGDGGIVLLIEFGPSDNDEAEQEEQEETRDRSSSSSKPTGVASSNDSHMSSIAVRVTQPGMIRRDEGQRDSYLHFMPLTRSELLALPSTQRYSLPTTVAHSSCVLWSINDEDSSSQQLKFTWAVMDQAAIDASRTEESDVPSDTTSSGVGQSCLKASFSLALPPHIPSCPTSISPQSFFTPPSLNSSEKEQDQTKSKNSDPATHPEEIFQTIIKLSLVGDVVRMPRPTSLVPLLVFVVLLFGFCCVAIFVYRSRSLTSYDFTHLRMRTTENEDVELMDESSAGGRGGLHQFTQQAPLSASQRSSSRNSSRSSLSKMDTVIESDYEDEEEQQAMVDKDDMERL